MLDLNSFDIPADSSDQSCSRGDGSEDATTVVLVGVLKSHMRERSSPGLIRRALYDASNAYPHTSD